MEGHLISQPKPKARHPPRNGGKSTGGLGVGRQIKSSNRREKQPTKRVSYASAAGGKGSANTLIPVWVKKSSGATTRGSKNTSQLAAQLTDVVARLAGQHDAEREMVLQRRELARQPELPAPVPEYDLVDLFREEDPPGPAPEPRPPRDAPHGPPPPQPAEPPGPEGPAGDDAPPNGARVGPAPRPAPADVPPDGVQACPANRLGGIALAVDVNRTTDKLGFCKYGLAAAAVAVAVPIRAVRLAGVILATATATASLLSRTWNWLDKRIEQRVVMDNQNVACDLWHRASLAEDSMNAKVPLPHVCGPHCSRPGVAFGQIAGNARLPSRSVLTDVVRGILEYCGADIEPSGDPYKCPKHADPWYVFRLCEAPLLVVAARALWWADYTLNSGRIPYARVVSVGRHYQYTREGEDVRSYAHRGAEMERERAVIDLVLMRDVCALTSTPLMACAQYAENISANLTLKKETCLDNLVERAQRQCSLAVPGQWMAAVSQGTAVVAKAMLDERRRVVDRSAIVPSQATSDAADSWRLPAAMLLTACVLGGARVLFSSAASRLRRCRLASGGFTAKMYTADQIVSPAAFAHPSVLLVVFVAPMFEEVLKQFFLRPLIGKHAGLCFGAFEYVTRLMPARADRVAVAFRAAPTVVMHAATTHVHPSTGLLVHIAWNLMSALSNSVFENGISPEEVAFRVGVANCVAGSTALAGPISALIAAAGAASRPAKRARSAPSKVFQGLGYRCYDVKLPENESVATFTVRPSFKEANNPMLPRTVMQRALVTPPQGVAMPIPDRKHPQTLMQGCASRVGRAAPEPDLALRAEFRQFVFIQVRMLADPVPADADLSVTTWLEKTHYPFWRVVELATVALTMKLFRNHLASSGRDEECATFIKTEVYACYKLARAILARRDGAKVVLGPAAKAMEEIIYKRPEFIKEIPTAKKPEYIMDLFSGTSGPYYESDYTSFESLFDVREDGLGLMQICEMQLYDHMLKYHNDARESFHRILAGTNKCVTPHFTMWLDGKRMSGEMVTSLGNGFTNLMVLAFIAYKAGARLKVVVEGDDALTWFSKPVDETIFERLGLRVKLTKHDQLFDASFCGLRLAGDSVEGYSVLKDPIKALVGLAWSHAPGTESRTVREKLLRAKCLSMVVECATSPIAGPVAKAVYEKLGHGDMRIEDDYRNRELVSMTRNLSDEQMMSKIDALMAGVNVTRAARAAYERAYGVTEREQFEVEREVYILGHLGGPAVSQLCKRLAHKDCHDYWERFVVVAELQ